MDALSDQQLLQDYAEHRSEAAFAALVISDSASPEYKARLYRMADPSGAMADAGNLGLAVRRYARDYQEFPSTFDQAAAYFRQDVPPPRKGGFELVYQGSRKDLEGIPESAIALIRQRDAWPRPGGKWARIYIMAGGEARVVESEDNFEAWEAMHVIPPHWARNAELHSAVSPNCIWQDAAMRLSPGSPAVSRMQFGDTAECNSALPDPHL